MPGAICEHVVIVAATETTMTEPAAGRFCCEPAKTARSMGGHITFRTCITVEP